MELILGMSGRHETNDELANMEVLLARLLHDMAGAVGAVVSCAECFIEDPESDDARVCLEDALAGAIFRFRLMRQAYSVSDDNTSFDNTRAHIEKYLEKKGVRKLSWNVVGQFFDSELVEKVNKLVAQAALFVTNIMIRGNEVLVNIEKEEFIVKIRLKLVANTVELHPDVEAMLEGLRSDRTACALTTQNVQMYFMSLLLAKYGAGLRFSAEESLVEIDLPCT